LKLSFERSLHEWQVIAEREEPESGVIAAAAPTGPVRAMTEPQINRYAFGETGGPLRLMPIVADRPVVTRPYDPLHVAPGGDVTIYLSSPLWVRIEVGEPPVLLQDTFIVRPSDTWFGPSTLEGDLCYASRTAGRLVLDEVPRRPGRAITATSIHNQTTSPLLLERISLPTSRLALFADDRGMLWTQDITLVHAGDTELADLTLEEGPPRHAPGATLVSEAREHGGRKTLFRAFGAMFK
jgi:hypothetical protein